MVWIFRLIGFIAAALLICGTSVFGTPSCAEYEAAIDPYTITDNNGDSYIPWTDEIMQIEIPIRGAVKTMSEWLNQFFNQCGDDHILQDGYARKIYINPSYLPDSEPFLRITVGIVVLIVTFGSFLLQGKSGSTRMFA